MRFFQANARLGFLLALSLLAGPVMARAQEHEPRTFGIPSVSYTMQAFTFSGDTAADNAAVSNPGIFGSRACTPNGFCSLSAGVFLPEGALVTSIQLDACDTDPAGAVNATLFRIGAQESGFDLLAQANTHTDLTPGCTLTSKALSTPHTIDNVNNSYYVRVFIFGNSNATRFQAVRIFYNLQVSPAPATATFTDVPTSDGAFKFIEALVAAGITAGCNASPPMYCPDDFVTRRQMAIFISKALGLQFAP